MMRRIVALQPALPLPRHRGRGGMMVIGADPAAERAGRRLPGVRTAARRDPDARARAVGRGGRDRSSPCPLEQALAGVEGLDILRSKSVPQLSSIELIFKPRNGPAAWPASWSPSGSRSVTPTPADLGSPPFMHAAAVGDEPSR